jgi:hypothetical protein
MATKYTKWAENIPNVSEIDQMAMKFLCETLRNLPKFGFLV